jgi:hypothetical protein
MHMYRVLAITVLLAAAVLPSPLEGQIRAMQRPTAPVGQHFRALQSPSGRFGVMNARLFDRRASFASPAVFRRRFQFRNSFGNHCLTDPFLNSFFCRQFFARNRFLFAQPVSFPYPVYASSYYQGDEQTPSTVGDRESGVAEEVERLTDEVEQIREDQLSREQSRQAALQPRPSVEDKTATTILVFRDGRQSEIQNYAIVGQTVWVFTEQRARKVPISDLNVEASTRVNAGRGVEFRLP